MIAATALALLVLSACSSEGGSSTPVAISPLEPSQSSTDDGGDATPDDEPVDMSAVVLEPAGSQLVTSRQSLYAAVVNTWRSEREFEAWKCRSNTGVTTMILLAPTEINEFTTELANEGDFIGGLGAIWSIANRESSRLLWLPVDQDTLSLRLENEGQDIVYNPDQELLSADFILTVTSVRIGPGRRFSGYVNEQDAIVSCQPFDMTSPVPTYEDRWSEP